jgi:hypothetical protein
MLDRLAVHGGLRRLRRGWRRSLLHLLHGCRLLRWSGLRKIAHRGRRVGDRGAIEASIDEIAFEVSFASGCWGLDGALECTRAKRRGEAQRLRVRLLRRGPLRVQEHVIDVELTHDRFTVEWRLHGGPPVSFNETIR